MTQQAIIKLSMSALCLLAFLVMALLKKDESSEPEKNCNNCKHGHKRKHRLGCLECIESKELIGWEKSDD